MWYTIACVRARACVCVCVCVCVSVCLSVCLSFYHFLPMYEVCSMEGSSLSRSVPQITAARSEGGRLRRKRASSAAGASTLYEGGIVGPLGVGLWDVFGLPGVWGN